MTLSPVLARFPKLDPFLAAEWRAHGGGGDWLATFEFSGKPMALHVDTGGMGGGFRYSVHESAPGRLAPQPGVSYETALGLPGFEFDLLRSDRFAEQMAQGEARLARLPAALGGKEMA